MEQDKQNINVSHSYDNGNAEYNNNISIKRGRPRKYKNEYEKLQATRDYHRNYQACDRVRSIRRKYYKEHYCEDRKIEQVKNNRINRMKKRIEMNELKDVINVKDDYIQQLQDEITKLNKELVNIKQ